MRARKREFTCFIKASRYQISVTGVFNEIRLAELKNGGFSIPLLRTAMELAAAVI